MYEHDASMWLFCTAQNNMEYEYLVVQLFSIVVYYTIYISQIVIHYTCVLTEFYDKRNKTILGALTQLYNAHLLGTLWAEPKQTMNFTILKLSYALFTGTNAEWNWIGDMIFENIYLCYEYGICYTYLLFAICNAFNILRDII